MQELKLKKTILTILSHEFQKNIPPEFGLVTIIDVQVSIDFAYADCYISNIPVNKQIIAFLASRTPYFQKIVWSQLKRRIVPKLRFYYYE